MENAKYQTKDGRIFFVSKCGENYATHYINGIKIPQAIIKPGMCVEQTEAKAQANLDKFAKIQGLQRITEEEFMRKSKKEIVNVDTGEIRTIETKKEVEPDNQKFDFEGEAKPTKIKEATPISMDTPGAIGIPTPIRPAPDTIRVYAEQINIENLMKHPDNEKLLPPLSLEEKKLLRDRMSAELEPQPFTVIQSKQGHPIQFFVLDGNNRLGILQEMSYKGTWPCIVKENMSDADQRTYIENAALSRRNLTREQKAEIARRQVARGVSQVEVADKLGQSQKWVSDQTREVKEVRKDAEEKAIVALAEKTDMTQEAIAEKVGVSRPKVNEIVRNSKFTKSDTILDDTSDDESEEDVIAEVEESLCEDAIKAKAEVKRAEKKLEEKKEEKAVAEKAQASVKDLRETIEIKDKTIAELRENLASKEKYIAGVINDKDAFQRALEGELKVTQEDLAKAEKKNAVALEKISAILADGGNYQDFLYDLESFLRIGNAKIFEKETAVEAEEYAEEEN